MNHEHQFDKNGSKKCALCGEKFDLPIKPIKKSAKLEGGIKRKK